MTYATFLLYFVLAPAIALIVWKRPPLWPLLPLLVIVYAAAVPWDNFAAGSGLWSFDPEKIIGIRLWHLPIEEYAFFGLQTLLTGAWVAHRLR